MSIKIFQVFLEFKSNLDILKMKVNLKIIENKLVINSYQN